MVVAAKNARLTSEPRNPAAIWRTPTHRRRPQRYNAAWKTIWGQEYGGTR